MTYFKFLMLFWMATLQLDCDSADVRLGREKIEVIHKGKTLQDLVVLNSRLAPHDLDRVNDFIRPKLLEESNAEGMMLQKNGIEDFRPLDLTIDTGKEEKEVEAGLFSDSDDGDEKEDFNFHDMPEYNHETKADFKGNQEAIDWLMKDPNEYNVESYEDGGSPRDVPDNFDHSHATHNALQDDQDEDDDDIKDESYLSHKNGDGKVRQGEQPREAETSHVRHRNHDYHRNHDDGVNVHGYFSGKAGKSRKKDDFGLGDYEDYGTTGRNTNGNPDQVDEDMIDNEMTDYNDGSSKKYEKSSSQNNVNRLLENQDAKLYKELSNFQNSEDYENFDKDDDDFDRFDPDYENDEGEWDYQDNVLHAHKKQTNEQPDRGSYSEWRDDTDDLREKDKETSYYDAGERDRQETDSRGFEDGNVSDEERDGNRGSGEDEESDPENIEESNDDGSKPVIDDQENNTHGNDKSKQGNGSERVGSAIHNENPTISEDATVVAHNSHAFESENNSALRKNYNATGSLEKENLNGPIGDKEIVTPDEIGNQTVTRGQENNHENRNISQLVLGEKISNDSSVMGKNFRNGSFHSLSKNIGGKVHTGAHASDSSENKVAVADPKELPNNDLSDQKDVEKSNNAKLEISFKTAQMFKSNEQGKKHHEVVQGKSDDISIQDTQANEHHEVPDGLSIQKPDQKFLESGMRKNDRRVPSDLIKTSSQMETGESRKDSRRHHRRHDSLPRIYSLADLNTMERIVSSLRGTAFHGTSPTKSSMQKKHGDLILKSLYYYPLHPTPQEDSDSPGVADHKFSEWNAWSTCSVSCGTGTIVRARVCLVFMCPRKDMYQTKTCLQPICQDELKEESLDAHNEIRTKHFSPPLTWSTSLAKKAETIANYLAGKKFLTLDDLRETSGESIAQIKHAGGNVARRAIRKWYNEVKSYSFSYPKINDRTRHFVQMVWKGTKELGLAVAKAPSGEYTFVVALYSPATDTHHHVRQNVLRPGHKHDVYATFRKRNT